jgi:uncharacterized membrane protein
MVNARLTHNHDAAMQLIHVCGYVPCIAFGMTNPLNDQNWTFAFLALVTCLSIAFIALFWSIEDQRQTAKRRIKR